MQESCQTCCKRFLSTAENRQRLKEITVAVVTYICKGPIQMAKKRTEQRSEDSYHYLDMKCDFGNYVISASVSDENRPDRKVIKAWRWQAQVHRSLNQSCRWHQTNHARGQLIWRLLPHLQPWSYCQDNQEVWDTFSNWQETWENESCRFIPSD